MSLECGHRQEQRVIKNSEASDRNLLAVSVEEPKGAFLGTAMHFSFPSQFVLLTNAASLTDDSLIQFVICNDLGFFERKCVIVFFKTELFFKA